jgi:formylglycine-generating enzyme required for sulfatase activity
MNGPSRDCACARPRLTGFLLSLSLSVAAVLVTGCTRKDEQRGAVSPIPVEKAIPRPVAENETREAAPPAPPIKVNVETNTLGMKMALIPAGEFTMGSSDGDANEKPPHKVRITKPFYLGQHEVTVGQFRQFVTGSGYTGAGGSWKTPFPSQTDDHPVVNVNWNDAKAFCGWLSKKEGKEYRLPTEAEWEYACRAGTQTKWSFGDDESELGSYAWFGGNSRLRTHPVGQKKPNPWGLYDMHGNAWEWCEDRSEALYRAESPQDDPKGGSAGTDRVLRGGCWFNLPENTRSTYRTGSDPDSRYRLNGFRVARTP